MKWETHYDTKQQTEKKEDSIDIKHADIFDIEIPSICLDLKIDD